MIWESYYWKHDLLKYAEQLNKRINQTKWFDSSLANTEKEIMLSAFMARKLFDSQKIHPEIENKNIDVISYRNNGKKINLLKRLAPENYFEVHKPIESTLNIRDLCNQIIHSYIFMLLMNEENGLQGFWVASDYKKFDYLYELKIEDYLNILNLVGSYWPQTEQYYYNPKKDDYVVYRDKEFE